MFLRLFRSLMPREEKFVERFCQHTEQIVAAAEALRSIFAGSDDFDKWFQTIRERESAADVITRLTIEAVHRSFITPFDRGEIHDLIVSLDDTIDTIEEIVQRIAIYRITKFKPEMVRLTEIIRDCAGILNSAMPLLAEVTRNATALRDMAIRISALEGQGDATLRQGLAALMQSGADPIAVLTQKEIYELLENAIDRCQDAMDVVQGIVIEHV
jgi:uncharacterized protein Yka (UPF0111/DUF47 family)